MPFVMRRGNDWLPASAEISSDLQYQRNNAHHHQIKYRDRRDVAVEHGRLAADKQPSDAQIKTILNRRQHPAISYDIYCLMLWCISTPDCRSRSHLSKPSLASCPERVAFFAISFSAYPARLRTGFSYGAGFHRERRVKS
jgi:hypothetical protein